MPQTVTRTRYDAQFRGAVRLCENAGIGGGHAFVVVTVQDQ